MATIRPFTPADYEGGSRVANVVWSEYPETADSWRHEDEHRDPKCLWARWVAEDDGQIVGYGEFTQWPGQYHPRKFDIGVTVLPDHHGQGIGATLYRAILAGLEPHQPIQLKGDTREDMTRGVAFAQRLGYVEKMRSWESRLDLTTFDPAPFSTEGARAAAEGIVIKTFAELAADPERNRKLYDLSWDLIQDVPSTDPPTRMTYEYFVEERLGHPDFLADGYFVALDGADYVGYTNFWLSQASADLYTGLTGVRRSHRRRGIAMALKLRALDYAKSTGAPLVKTWNETGNEGMLAINIRLGFVRQPAWISFIKSLADEA
jgi:mycothiol synthase